MPFTPYTIDDGIKSKAAEGGMHIPEGGYLMEIVRCEPSAEDKDSAHIWKLRVVDGAAGIGSIQTFWANMTEKENTKNQKSSTFFLTGTMISAALPEEAADMLQSGLNKVQVRTYAEHVKLAEQLGEALAGNKVFALVQDDNRNGTIYSKVLRVGPPSQYAGPSAQSSIALGPAPSGGVPANNVQPDENFFDAAQQAFKNLGVKA